MREILFRGLIRRSGEKVGLDGSLQPGAWVYGGVFQGSSDFSIIYSYDPIQKHPVYSDTVGQYTGLMDDNDNRIFEGDIVCVYDYLLGSEYDGRFFVVRFFEFGFFLVPIGGEVADAIPFFNECAHYEVVGNVFQDLFLFSKEADDV